MTGRDTIWLSILLAAGFGGYGRATHGSEAEGRTPVAGPRRESAPHILPRYATTPARSASEGIGALGRPSLALRASVAAPAQLPPEPAPLPEQPPSFEAVEPIRPAPLMTLVDFEAVAAAENPALAAASARVEAAHGRWVQAGLYPNTVIGYTAEEMGAFDSAGKQGMFASQRFVTGGKLRLDRAVAAQEVEAARIECEATRRRVFNDVRIRFYDLMIAQWRLELSQKLAQIGEESAASSRKLLGGEQISRTNLLQAEVEAEEAHMLHDNARGDHREAWRRLCAVAGIPHLVMARVAGDPSENLSELSWDQCLATLVHESPELAVAAVRVERARLAVCRERRERIPNVDVKVAVLHENIAAHDTAGVQVGLPLPLLDRNQGNIHRAEAELAEACAQRKRTELALLDRLAVAYRRYENARHQTDRYAERILPRAQESLKWVQEGYAEEQVDYLTLLTSQRTYFRANLDYLDSLRELRTAAVVVEGLLLTGSLGTTGL